MNVKIVKNRNRIIRGIHNEEIELDARESEILNNSKPMDAAETKLKKELLKSLGPWAPASAITKCLAKGKNYLYNYDDMCIFRKYPQGARLYYVESLLPVLRHRILFRREKIEVVR